MVSVTRSETTLLTADDLARLPDSDDPTELVAGRIERKMHSYPYRSYICGQVATILGAFVRERRLGFLLGCTGIVTRRDPDTVRAADMAFYRTERLAGGKLPSDHYLEVPPDLIVEVLSPSKPWPDVLAKVAEYLSVGVTVVAVVEPEHRSVHVYSGRAPVRIVSDAESLTFPEVLPGLSVAVKELFE